MMTARLGQVVGLDKIASYAERLGVYDQAPHNYAMVLGADETTALRMATAYSMIVNGGKRITPTIIDRIQDRNGTTIFRAGADGFQRMAPVFLSKARTAASPSWRQSRMTRSL